MRESVSFLMVQLCHVLRLGNIQVTKFQLLFTELNVRVQSPAEGPESITLPMAGSHRLVPVSMA